VVILAKDSQRKIIVILLLLLFSTYNQAENIKPVNNETTKVASMVASPNSCTLKINDEVCEMTFHILWQTPELGNFCLHSKESVKPLKCWYGVDHGNIKLDFFAHILENSKHYSLLDAQGDHLIASVDVPIIGTFKQRQRAQRRRRGFWRMF
jgi:DUF3019 family protein